MIKSLGGSELIKFIGGIKMKKKEEEKLTFSEEVQKKKKEILLEKLGRVEQSWNKNSRRIQVSPTRTSLSIPKSLKDDAIERHKDTFFRCEVYDDKIIFKSGCELLPNRYFKKLERKDVQSLLRAGCVWD